MSTQATKACPLSEHKYTPSVYSPRDLKVGIQNNNTRCLVSVGTSAQPQKVDVLLDTGSFELWVNPDCAKSNEPNFCQTFGQYDPNKSSTAKSLGQPYKIQYGSGSTSGTYYTDDINFSGMFINPIQWALWTNRQLVMNGLA